MTDNHDLYLLCMRQREELRKLNRALNRKNRKLKAQYDELHRQKNTPKPNSSMHEKVREYRRRGLERVVLGGAELDALLREHDYALKGVRPMSRRDCETRTLRPAYVQPRAHVDFTDLTVANSAAGEHHPLAKAQRLTRYVAHGFRFLTTEGEPAVFCRWVGILGSVVFRGCELMVNRIECQENGDRIVNAHSGAFDDPPRTFTIPKEAFR